MSPATDKLSTALDYDPLQLFHVGTNGVATRRDFRALGRTLKALGAQVVFSPVQQSGDALEEKGVSKTSARGSRSQACATAFLV